jgi:hypothetical protein
VTEHNTSLSGLLNRTAYNLTSEYCKGRFLDRGSTVCFPSLSVKFVVDMALQYSEVKL